jgi:hypothetical protein
MKAKVIIPIVTVIALLLYLLSSRPSSEESSPSPAPVIIELPEQIEENEGLIEAAVETSPEAESTSTQPLLRYDPKKDPLYSQEAKQVYYDRLAAHYSWTQGKDLIPNILKRFSGNEEEVRKAIGQSKRFEIYAAVPYLKEIIQNPDDPNFRLALGALIFFDEDAAYSYAIEQLKGEDALRWTSIYLRAIINRNKIEYIDDLHEVIEEKGPVHRIIAGALSRMGEDIASTDIIERLPAKNAAWTGLEALANTKDVNWAPSLKEHYENSTNLGSRLYSAYALLKLGYSEYREPIVSSVLELGTIPPMDSDAFRDLVKEKGRITDYGINDFFLAMELLEKIEQPDALEILAQVATQTVETNSPISEHALALIAKDQSEKSLQMLLELTEAGVVPFSPIRAKLFALYQTEEAEQHMESVIPSWDIEEYLIVAETKGWRGFFRDPRVN